MGTKTDRGHCNVKEKLSHARIQKKSFKLLSLVASIREMTEDMCIWDFFDHLNNARANYTRLKF